MPENSAAFDLQRRRTQPEQTTGGETNEGTKGNAQTITDPMTTFRQFESRLTAWCGQLSRDYNPVMDPGMKNRLQAIGEIRDRVSKMQPSGEFRGDIDLLMNAVKKCQDEFDPVFDTEYGSGRDVHNTLIGLLQESKTRGSFDAVTHPSVQLGDDLS